MVAVYIGVSVAASLAMPQEAAADSEVPFSDGCALYFSDRPVLKGYDVVRTVVLVLGGAVKWAAGPLGLARWAAP